MAKDFEKLHNGKLYFPNDEELSKFQLECLDKLFEFNNIKPSDQEKKNKMMKEMFAEVGEGCYIETPFHSNFGGRHVHLGNYVYANFNLTTVDDTDIFIEDNVMIGPNVTLATAAHPISPELREKGVQYNLPIKICKNVWLGAGVIVLPGVTIGENSVIGAGSIVTKDIPPNVVAMGQPCTVYREISEEDKIYYRKKLKIKGNIIE